MGKTSKPVSILVLDKDLYESPEVQELIAKGHPVVLSGEFHCCDDSRQPTDYDLILGRKAWYMDTKHLKYIEKIAIPAARKRQENRSKETKSES